MGELQLRTNLLTLKINQVLAMASNQCRHLKKKDVSHLLIEEKDTISLVNDFAD